MIETFVLRAELSSPHSTGAEMRKLQQEAVKAVERDKASKGERNGGLFHGIFEKASPHVAVGLRDGDDGVLRCPDCNWEVHDHRCEGCQQRVMDPNGPGNNWLDFSDESSSEDSMIESDVDDVERIRRPGPGGPGRWVDDEIILEGEGDDDEDWEDDGHDAEDALEQSDYYGALSPDRSSDGAVALDDDDDASNRPRPPRPLTFAGLTRQNRRVVVEESDGDSEDDDDEGSLQDFVVHDTPEARRPRRDRRQQANSHARPNGPWAIPDSSPAPEPAVRRRNARRTVPDDDDDDETQSSVSEASSRPPLFLGDSRRVYARGLRDVGNPIHISSDYDEEEEALLRSGYQTLPHTTASETEEDGFSSPPHAIGRRRNMGSISTPGSVFSVPEEDETEEGDTQYGDDDDSEEDEDGDVMMSQASQRASRQTGGGPRRRTMAVGNRTQPVEIDSDDSEPVPPRRRRQHRVGGHAARSGYFSSHSRGGSGNSRHRNRLSAQINPDVQALLSLHSQRLEEQQYNFLGNRLSSSVSPARTMTPIQRAMTPVQRSTTPVQRMRTPVQRMRTPVQRIMTPTQRNNMGNRRFISSSRESTPLQRVADSISPPPFSPMQSPDRGSQASSRATTIDSITSPASPNSTQSYSTQQSNSQYSQASPRYSQSLSPRSSQAQSSPQPSNPWFSSVSPQPVRTAESPTALVSSSATSTPRMRTRPSRGQLRSANSRIGLRSNTSSPAPTFSGASIAGLSGRIQPGHSGILGAAGRPTARRNTPLTTEDVRARGEAAIRQARMAGGHAGRSATRRESASNNSDSINNVRGGANNTAANTVGADPTGQGRRLGALIGGGPATGRGGGPLLVIGSEDD